AEDGIRDYKVTGVQTCALPISRLQGGGTPPPRGGHAVPREARPGGAAQGRGGEGAGGLDRGARHESPPRGTEVPDQPEGGGGARSEERRVGKGCRAWWDGC